MSTIRDRVQYLCDKNGIAISVLEKELGFGNGTIAKWDKSRPRGKSLMAVSKYFGVTVDSLLYDDEPEQKENPAAVIGNEVDDAVHALVINLFDRLSPEDQKDLIADLIEKARNQ